MALFQGHCLLPLHLACTIEEGAALPLFLESETPGLLEEAANLALGKGSGILSQGHPASLAARFGLTQSWAMQCEEEFAMSDGSQPL